METEYLPVRSTEQWQNCTSCLSFKWHGRRLTYYSKVYLVTRLCMCLCVCVFRKRQGRDKLSHFFMKAYRQRRGVRHLVREWSCQTVRHTNTQIKLHTDTCTLRCVWIVLNVKEKETVPGGTTDCNVLKCMCFCFFCFFCMCLCVCACVCVCVSCLFLSLLIFVPHFLHDYLALTGVFPTMLWYLTFTLFAIGCA